MKNLILILIIAFAAVQSQGNTEPQQEAKTVIAFSGLKLRTAPNMDSKVLKVIPFAEKLIVESYGSTLLSIEWLEGRWAKVSYEGRKGYVFDAFLTSLPIPFNDYELSAGDGDLSYTLLSWLENNYRLTAKADTVEYNNHIKTVQQHAGGITASIKESPHAFQIRVELPDIRVGDAYNLLKSMLKTKSERERFENSALFISEPDGSIDQIKIEAEAPVEIRKTNSGVEIVVTSYQHICGL